MDEDRFFRGLRQMETSFRYSRRRHTKEVECHYVARLVRLLEAAGIHDIVRNGSNDPADLVIQGHQVEVKVSRPQARRAEYYQFNLRGKRHNLNGNLLICLCVTRDDELCPFIMPVRAVGERATVEISSDPWAYMGQWARYRAAYDYLREEQPKERKEA